jgi:cytochrome c peroxidase
VHSALVAPVRRVGALPLLVGACFTAAAASLQLEVQPRFGSAALEFDRVGLRTLANQTISVTRLDFLISGVALRREDGDWLNILQSEAYVGGREGRTHFELNDVPAGKYSAIRFLVGLEPALNKADPAQYPAGHPLNPEVNGLHWGWQGGYVFMALEGRWENSPKSKVQSPKSPAEGEQSPKASACGYSFHLANAPQLMKVELPLDLNLGAVQMLRVGLDVEKIFAGITLNEANSTTHSRPGDELAKQLAANIERAFTVQGVKPPPSTGDVSQASPVSQPLLAPTATPYRLTISALFPRPELPRDNPLTEEGVGLGRLLFHDRLLSCNYSQSCASCHELSAAGAEQGPPVSIGAEGQAGTRNAMPLFNLAWKSSFFWDGRAATLREQVLQPIQNPLEMHEPLTNLVSRLRQSDYPARFAAAFGSPEISPDRIARALEQFLLTQVSHESKFDRVLAGAAQLTDQEQRGFELFNTEYDPWREQFGADCFHCHGGPLFQSVAFANNGLDAEPKDIGRAAVTKREGDRGKFAVPSLRNLSVSGPYMHDGRFKTLEEVVEHYSTGVKRSATLDPNLAKHPDGGVPLSLEDKHALVAFLKTLTDERYLQPVHTVASAK